MKIHLKLHSIVHFFFTYFILAGILCFFHTEVKASDSNLPELIIKPDFSAVSSEGKEPFTVKFIDKSESKVSEWIWDFGDGNSSVEQNPIHTYKNSGNYTVTLFINYENGTKESASKKNYIKVLKRSEPLAEFTAIPLTGNCPLTVRFFDESKGDRLSSWMWDFGNGNTSSEQNPVVVFKTSGIYTITLTVSNSLGANVNRNVNLIRVKDDVGPTSGFTAAHLIVAIGVEVNFSDFSSGEIKSRTWNFGDGHTSNEQNPKHSYSKEGLYNVSLTVFDNTGSDTLTKGNYIRIIGN